MEIDDQLISTWKVKLVIREICGHGKVHKIHESLNCSFLLVDVTLIQHVNYFQLHIR